MSAPLAPLLPMAFRNLQRSRRRTALSVGALVAGLAILISLRGFMMSVIDAQIRMLVEGPVGALQIHRAGYMKNVQANPLSLDMEWTPALEKQLRSLPEVTGVAPRIAFGGSLVTPDTDSTIGKTSFLTVLAWDPEAEKNVGKQLSTWIPVGEKPDSVKDDAIWISQDIATALSLPLQNSASTPESERPSLLAPDPDSNLNGVLVRAAGRVESAALGDKRLAWTSLKTAQTLLHMEGKATEVAIQVQDWSRAQDTKARLQNLLGPTYEVHTWSEINPTVMDLFTYVNLVFNAISAICLLVALLGVVNTMLMNVLERTREIGTLLSVGASRFQILVLFVAEGAWVGFLGALLGALFASVILALIRGLGGIHIPAPGNSVPMWLMPDFPVAFAALAFVVALVGAALATLWPAWRASRLDPVEALRHI